jgi:hypothetical protein
MKIKYFILFFLFTLTIKVRAQVEIVSTGSGSPYILDVPAIFPLRAGVQITFKANVLNPTPTTINVSSTGIKTIKKEGGTVDLVSGDIKGGQVVTIVYDGTNWQMLSPSGNSPALGSVSGSGTQNYVTKWNNAGGTTIGNSSVYDGGNGVGIFNNTPAGDLHIFKNNGPRFILDADGANTNGSATIDFTTGGNNTSTSFVGAGGVTGWQLKSYTSGFSTVTRQNDFSIRYYNGSTFNNSMYFDNTGNIGIDMLNPTSKLYIVGSGTSNSTSSLRITNNSGSDMLYVNDAGEIGIRTAIPTANLHVVGTARITSLVGPGTVIADLNGNLSIATGANSTNWTLLGNLGTVDGTNFIGTTDNVPFNIRVNGQKAGRIENTGGNTFFGYQSGLVNTGVNNSGFGSQTLISNTTGGSNSAVGLQALYNNTTGNNNVAHGFLTMVMNTAGSNNTAIGYHALTSSKAANNVTAVGYNAMYYANDQTTPYNNNNVAFGYEALRGSTTASSNTGLANSAIGYQTLQANSSGTGNSVLGATAMQNNTTGNYNVSLGTSTLLTNSTGTGNLAAGTSSMLNNATGSYNVALGYEAMYNNRSGSNAVAIGYNSMRYANNTGTAYTNYNVAVGFEALRGSVTPSSNTGNNNTATGAMALSANSSGYENTANGMYSLYVNSTGYDNTATGYSALNSNLTGYWNTANGGYSLAGNTSGIRNVGFGFQAGSANQGGNDNVFIGTQAGFFGSNHSNNTFVGAFSGANNTANSGVFLGYNSGTNNTSGSANTYLGYQSGFTGTTAGNNTMVGFLTGYATTSSNNSFFGSNVGQGNTSGAQNTFLGAYAGSNNTTGSQNVFIGYSADILTTTQRNKVVAIGYNARVDADNVMALGGSGPDALKVGIGTSIPSTQLHVVGNARITGLVGPGTVVSDASGNLSIASGGTITGSGTTNYVARWTPSGTTLGIGLIYDNNSVVGIGTGSTPSNSRLHVHSTSGGGNLRLTSASTGQTDSDGFTISNDGGTSVTMAQNENSNWIFATNSLPAMTIIPNANVGVGTLTPANKLVVEDDVDDVMKITRDNTVTFAHIAKLAFSNKYGGGENVLARIGIVDGGSNSGTLVFETKSNTTFGDATTTEKMRIIANGNVGIGTQSPGAKLEVADANFFKLKLNRTAGAGFKSEIAFSKLGTDRFSIGVDMSDVSTQEFYIYDNSALQNRLHINSAGNVGIGTTNALVKLQISGQIRMGSEAGTSQPPTYPTGGGNNGLIIRRIFTTNIAAGQIVAVTDEINLERDGTNGGWRVNRFGPTTNQVCNCTGTTSTGATLGKAFNNLGTGITQIYNNAENVVFIHCIFGNPYNSAHTTEVTLTRNATDYFWMGTTISTFNQ